MKLNKKLSSVALVFLLSTSFANAKNGFVVGADVLQNNVKYTYAEISRQNADPYGPQSPFSEENQVIRGGINLGYNFDVNEHFFLSPELFYERIGSKARDFYFDHPLDPSNFGGHKVNNRYGARLNLGYKLGGLISGGNFLTNQLSKVSIFVNAGAARVDYSVSIISGGNNKSSRDYDITEIYGLGLRYDVTDSVFLKLAYDQQTARFKYVDSGFATKADINTARFGLGYIF
jgi:opacity protein-like surface antigen